MDLALFKVRQFRLVNAATLLFATAFYGMLLSNIIFLQTDWHYSVLRAALAAAPGPLVVTVVARTVEQAGQPIGHRPVLLAGARALGRRAARCSRCGSAPHRTGSRTGCPRALLTGLGIGMTLPVQSGAAVEALPPGAVRARLGDQLQLPAARRRPRHQHLRRDAGHPSPAHALTAYHRVWWVFAALSVASGAAVIVPAAAPGHLQALAPIRSTRRRA